MRKAEAADIVALEVYRSARNHDQPLSIGLVRSILSDLLSHHPECDCGLCSAALKVREVDVYCVAEQWVSVAAGTP